MLTPSTCVSAAVLVDEERRLTSLYRPICTCVCMVDRRTVFNTALCGHASVAHARAREFDLSVYQRSTVAIDLYVITRLACELRIASCGGETGPWCITRRVRRVTLARDVDNAAARVNSELVQRASCLVLLNMEKQLPSNRPYRY